jgi:hypothetical protein
MERRPILTLAGAALVTALSTSVPRAGEEPAGKAAATPDAAALSESLKNIRTLLKDDYTKAKSPSAKLALAKKQISLGVETSDNANARYALFLEGRDLALEAGDVETALLAIDEIARRYLDVNALDLKLEALDKAARSARTREACTVLSIMCMSVTETARDVGNFKVAEAASNLAASNARKSKKGNLAAWTTYLARDIAESAKEHARAWEAAELLRTNKSNPEAMLTLGRFRALVMGQWEQGLPLLQGSSDPVLKTIALQEMQQPAEASAQIELGEAWWAAAEKAEGLLKSRARSRAMYWYERSLATLQGLSRTQAEEKLSRCIREASDYKPGLVALLHEGRELKRKARVRIDPQVNFDWGFGPPEKGLPADRFSIRWTGHLRTPLPGKYTLTVDVDDGVRLWVDDELLIEHWALGPGRPLKASAYLTDRWHPLRIEYYEEHSPARIKLFWAREGGLGEELVPSYALFHDATAKREAAK